ncbi:DUF3606 domain-containing protein [Mesorhizobium caraganae]|uniref:DUF3606 domain-containing protein n=1 Tax=Mesorhizobium caraganae TaxID=483206 RepID=A0ABV1YXM5_9HYPH
MGRCPPSETGDDYEVQYFAKKVGITPQLKDLIAKHGNNRATLEREAKAMGSDR